MRRGRVIVCYGCGGRGGTLRKVDDGVYAHAGCDARAMARAVADKANMEADRKEADEKEKVLQTGLVLPQHGLRVVRSRLPQKRP